MAFRSTGTHVQEHRGALTNATATAFIHTSRQYKTTLIDIKTSNGREKETNNDLISFPQLQPYWNRDMNVDRDRRWWERD